MNSEITKEPIDLDGWIGDQINQAIIKRQMLAERINALNEVLNFLKDAYEKQNMDAVGIGNEDSDSKERPVGVCCTCAELFGTCEHQSHSGHYQAHGFFCGDPFHRVMMGPAI